MNEKRPDPRPDPPAMREALRLAAAERRKPTEADRPPISTFPATPASREARRYDKSRTVHG